MEIRPNKLTKPATLTMDTNDIQWLVTLHKDPQFYCVVRVGHWFLIYCWDNIFKELCTNETMRCNEWTSADVTYRLLKTLHPFCYLVSFPIRVWISWLFSDAGNQLLSAVWCAVCGNGSNSTPSQLKREVINCYSNSSTGDSVCSIEIIYEFKTSS